MPDSNRHVEAAWAYHDATKHSYASIRTNPHFLDFANQPLPFKVYPALEPSRLPSEVRQTGIAALSAIAESVPAQPPARANAAPDLEALAQLLHLSAGITRHRKYPGGESFFRAAACTGALYEVELYLVCGGLADLQAGVYHFAPAEFGLRQLRAGDYRSVLIEASGDEPAIAHAPLTIVCTCTYWRNAWKYQARTYRHFGWDNGTLLANLLAVSAASGLPAEIVLGFVDAEVNRLLDLDTRREVSLCLVPIGRTSDNLLPAPREAPALGLETIPLSERVVEYPAMLEVHEASSLGSIEEITPWRGKQPIFPSPALAGETVCLPRLPQEELPRDTIEQVILRRGSTRTFDKTASITLAQLATILDYATRGLPADFLEPPGAQLNDLYLIVHSVECLKPGAYFFGREQSTLELLQEGEFRTQAPSSWSRAGSASGRMRGHLLSLRF
ncbi:MAG TPA: SagB family peptide dehydrogenase, partial [Terriglobales bacterium]|nr:SagB family peptide dehydrogenase [Terriglobales bacterium]